jgi:hypothetical protein
MNPIRGSIVLDSEGKKNRSYQDLIEFNDVSLPQIWFLTFTVIFEREVRRYRRNFNKLIIVSSFEFIMGIIVAMLFGSIQFEIATGSAPDQQATQIVSSQLAFTIISINLSLHVFQVDRLIRKREITAGISVIPYYIGKAMASFLETICLTFSFLCSYYPSVQANASFLSYFIIFSLLQMAVAGLANFLCVILRDNALISTGFLVVLWTMGGIDPTISDISERLSVVGDFLHGISPYASSYELHIIYESESYSDAWAFAVQGTYNYYGFSNENKEVSIGLLFVYWIVSNILACSLLMFGKSFDSFLLYLKHRIPSRLVG